MAKTETAAYEAAPKFFKEQLLRSVRYEKRRDLLAAVLKDGAAYTTDEVDAALEKYLKGKVK